MTDTIAAIATRNGSAALGIIRISGPDAAGILEKVVNTTAPFDHPRRICVAHARDVETREVIDQVMCFFAKGPGTVTGEDVAEIHGHGGILVMESLLLAVLKNGARPALPGEFTSRAYRNGRMDLTRAEAVMALIGARSQRAARVAARQMAGSIGAGLSSQYETLTELAAHLEAGLDFPDEDLPEENLDQMERTLESVVARLQQAEQSYTLGSRLTDGATVVIAGPSNAGKSSLLNRLTGEDRALVDAEPGTTRDIVEARGEIAGIPVVYLDTAGFRASAEAVEQRGMEKSKQALRRADLVLFVCDGAGAAIADNTVSMLLSEINGPVVLVQNKCDVTGFSSLCPNLLHPDAQVSTSAKTGQGMDSLARAMANLLNADARDTEVLITTARQHAAVRDALSFAQQGLQMLRSRRSLELVSTDLRASREALASLWGRHAQDEVIDRIFSSFCLGK